MTRILHTADWHLGARLVELDRLPEQQAFLDWLLARIAELRPDLLLLAGDVFDTANPPQQALAAYYRFLAALATQAPFCSALILGGNHDSPLTLDAPREVLRPLKVRVVGHCPATHAEALHDLFPDVLLCATPYLRERDVRQAIAGQSFSEVAAGIREGVRSHYAALLAEARAAARGRLLIGTGHLTVTGSSTSDSERDIHIGNLGNIGAECFEGFDYVALGHIHKPQALDARGVVRYSGSPIHLSFSEVGIAKEVRVLDIAAGRLEHRALAVPEFRTLLRLRTDLAGLASCLKAVASHKGRAGIEGLEPWIELTVSDGALYPDLDRQVKDLVADLPLRVLKVLNGREEAAKEDEARAATLPALQDMGPVAVFHERLKKAGIDENAETWAELNGTFAELLGGLNDAERKELP